VLVRRIVLAVIALSLPFSAFAATDPARLRKVAHDFYAWRAVEFPVSSSDQGLHTWDGRLTDYSPAALAKRLAHVKKTLEQLSAMETKGWSKDDRVDFLLFRSDVEALDFSLRELQPERTNPQLYTGECSTAIFSLIKKEYAPPRTRAIAATKRLRAMPLLLEVSKSTLTRPVRLYAQLAIDSARSTDSLFNESLEPIADKLSPTERQAFDEAKHRALKSLHSYADWLEKNLKSMAPFRPMGEAQYNYMLHHILLLPLDAKQVAMLGETELARYRALESLLPDPSLAEPNPQRASHIPADQDEFLKSYESRQAEMISFLGDKKLVTLPSYLGHFSIRQLPEAFKPTSPGGFMNPPGVFDDDPAGFYFIPTYNPKSGNFYIRAAIEDPRPILGHEGIPGHFLQLSMANHLSNQIRRMHGDTVFIEGWALYGEEMLMRTGLYPEASASQGQILRLSRYRSARIGVDVNLHTGRWTFEQAVKYFMEAGGLDREAAEGEAAGAASDPTQKISYITGKWQIMRLLGKYRDRKGSAFRLGDFHDKLLSYGSLPLSIVEWLMLDDRSMLDQALQMR
jgi:uncharacterized protein (DUF885 family)